jgi:hypothetical protein
MSPILGIIASSRLVAAATSYESIATVTVGGAGASSITFSSIPATYTHLQIRVLAQNSVSGDYDWSLRFNSDTGANYTKHQLYGDGTTAYATGSASQNQIPGGFMYLTSWSPAVVDILDYTSTSKNKTVRLLTGSDNNGGGFAGLRSGVWFATPAAITSITIIPTSGGSGFLTNSSFALYGIKGA